MLEANDAVIKAVENRRDHVIRWMGAGQDRVVKARIELGDAEHELKGFYAELRKLDAFLEPKALTEADAAADLAGTPRPDWSAA